MNWVICSRCLLTIAFIIGILLNPLLPLAFFPDSEAYAALLRRIRTLTIHFSHKPASLVCAAIWPEESPLALLVVIHILPFVLPAIGPSEYAIAMHLVVVPVARVAATVLPGVSTLAVYVILAECALELVAVVPLEQS